eukprot:NODE_1899_length_1762_cov_156.906040_g1615_i0.p1 GENE.NODE_1899_length_1762_cov_156.906040_g1615_i0~~NODE_1899_length_1762_cov_156.906040_g1615_i0.p1  ORF type:complete len:518 (+),score=55.47 NODE_1899_length_1762_cov_156.906040_g1615_i0:60-1556(+)
MSIINLLLLAETGKGKSTLINMLANYFLGGSLDQLKVVIKTPFLSVTEPLMANNMSECNINDNTKSCTRGCWDYKFTLLDGRIFNVIDSAGLGDTDGVEQDDQNINIIMDHVSRVGTLTAIVIIFNGSECRINSSIKMVLEKLAGNLPDEVVEKNLILVLTKTTRSGSTFNLPAFESIFSKPREVFYMDNSAFSKDPVLWRDDHELREEVEENWRRSLRTCGSLVKLVSGMQQTSTIAFQTMREKRDNIKKDISALMCDIKKLHKTQELLEALQIGLSKNEQDMKNYENFKKSEQVTFMDVVPCSYHSTVCMTHISEKVICHDHCGLNEVSSHGNSAHFSGCACMNGSTCTKCGCGPSSHYHARVQVKEQTKTIESILHETKAMYDKCNSEIEDGKKKLDSMKGDLDAVSGAIAKKRAQVEELFRELKSLCSRFNFVNELSAVLDVLRHEAQTLKSTNARKEAEESIKHLELLADQLTPPEILNKNKGVKFFRSIFNS